MVRRVRMRARRNVVVPRRMPLQLLRPRRISTRRWVLRLSLMEMLVSGLRFEVQRSVGVDMENLAGN
jgi:hypothetical protein